MSTLVAVIACAVLVAISELARIAVLRAGSPTRATRIVAPLVGMLAAYLCVVALALAFYRAHGVPRAGLLEVHVEQVVDGYPATGKLERGDRIVAIDDAALTKSLSLLVDERNGAPVKLTVLRGGTRRDVTLQPIGHDGHWVLGFRPAMAPATTHELGVALEHAARFPIEQTKQLMPQSEPTADPGGPARIVDAYVVHATARELVLREALRFMTYVLLLLLALGLVRVVRAATARYEQPAA